MSGHCADEAVGSRHRPAAPLPRGPAGFVHLHTHTHFSFGLGASSPEALVAAARERGFDTLACTDTNGVYGAVEFQQAAEEAGVRPILGAHLVGRGQETVALAVDEHGWAALCRAITALHWNPDLALSAQLATDRRGLILLSQDVDLLERIVRLSGPADLYAELRPGKRRHEVLARARALGLPAAVTNGVVAAHPEDWVRHRLLCAIHGNTTLSALPPGAVWPREAWLRPGPDMTRLFPDYPEGLGHARDIAERCRYRIPIGRTVPPRLAHAEDALSRLRALAYEGAERRYGTLAPVTRERLEHELGIIELKGFADYFLVVRDIVEHGPTHCGRGSVANSIVSYALGITHVDPLASGLLFERFLNPARRDPPDIDLDFPWDERDQVLAYVFRQYPHPQAAMVANHNCLRLRGAIREVAKVHGRPAGEIREVTRRIPWHEDRASLADLLATHPNFQGLNLPDAWRTFVQLAQPLVGTPRHLSLHPGGVVIVPGALTDFVPTQPAVKELDGHPDLTVPVIQFEKDGAEDAGLVKIDLLGNRSLAVIRDAIAAVREHTGRAIDYTTSDPADDPATQELFRTGRTMGVFYTESPASRQLCQKSRAGTYDLLVLNTSIIRPASNKYIRAYLERLHGGPYEPLHPVLRDVLSETFGIMVYQEDVVNVCAAYAGMPLATADGLRKSLSKKRPTKRLAAYAEEFFRGAVALGRDPDVTRRVWEMVMSFAGYSFCKGHSCSYIQVAQHSCYLRAHYPAEFMAGVLANGGGFYHPFAYVAEAMRMGLTVRPPDINASAFRTTGRDREVRIGFQFIKGLSADACDRIVSRRTTPYRSLADLRRRTGLHPDHLRTLIKVGALDSIAGELTRPMLLWTIDSTRPIDDGRQLDHAEHLVGANPAPLPRCPAAPPLQAYSAERRRREEHAALSFVTDGHPMTLFAEQVRRFRTVPSPKLHRYVGRHVVVAGMLTTAKPVRTVQDEPMEFATFDDGHGLIETVLFPGVYRARSHVLFDQGPFLLRGLVQEEFGAVTLSVTHLDRLERAAGRIAHR